MDDTKRTDLAFINKIYRYMKNDMPIETFMEKFHVSFPELNGILELCKIYGKDIELENMNGTIVFKKNVPKKVIYNKDSVSNEKLIHTELCVVSDTHFGNIHQQLHLLNQVYEEAYNRGITTVLHCGDLVDGNYRRELSK